MAVSFCGHSTIMNRNEVASWLSQTIDALIEAGESDFYLGGYGCFDSLAANLVSERKKRNHTIRAFLIIPYLNQDYDTTLFDGTIYPPLETVPKRYAIVHRNRWMIDHSDWVIAYVTHSWGGAATTLKYAQQRKKRIILFGNPYNNG